VYAGKEKPVTGSIPLEFKAMDVTAWYDLGVIKLSTRVEINTMLRVTNKIMRLAFNMSRN
jgi:hypothetical protein